MPSIPDEKKTPVGAICAPPASNGVQTSSSSLPQPRQPNSLQGLLRFAMEATKNEDSTTESQFLPMDEERKKFLEAALQSMTINVVEVLQEQISKLMKVDTVKEDDDVTEYLTALEVILDYIDNIDIANDFHKIGGFLILKPCLSCKNPNIRSGGCALIAELCQNNPECQKIILDNDFLPILLHILNTDNNNQVGVKCIYAISALVRENNDGFSQLIRYGGLDVLMKTLPKEDDRFRIKTAFLFGSLCNSQPDFRSRLVFHNIIPILIKIVSEERKPSSEHVLSLLTSLVEENMSALNECKNPQHNLKDVLQTYLKGVENKEEFREEEEYCRRLLQLITS